MFCYGPRESRGGSRIYKKRGSKIMYEAPKELAKRGATRLGVGWFDVF